MEGLDASAWRFLSMCKFTHNANLATSELSGEVQSDSHP